MYNVSAVASYPIDLYNRAIEEYWSRPWNARIAQQVYERWLVFCDVIPTQDSWSAISSVQSLEDGSFLSLMMNSR